MRARRRLLPFVGLLAVTAAMTAAALATAASWGSAIVVPGSAALNLGGNASLNSISCATAGSCAAGGYYKDGAGHYQGFVVDKRNGVWRKTVDVPGLAALDLGFDIALNSVSCAAAGSCTAGGAYKDGAGDHQAYVADKKRGVWRKAVEVPGTAALNVGGNAYLISISCTTTDVCAAGGYYTDGAGHSQAFVVDKKNGVWRKAVKVPGMAALNVGNANLSSISCATARSCTAVGSYTDAAGHHQAFVADKKNGVWRRAVEVPGTAALNLGGYATVYSVSCATATSCAAGGSYKDGTGHYQAFVVNKRKGVWRKAAKVPGTAALNLGGEAALNTISCATSGSCTAGGYYADGASPYQAFVVSKKNGVWRKAVEVPGTAALNVGGQANVNTISCATASSCAAGGYYTDGAHHYQAFVVSKRNGVWRKAVEVPGTATLNLGGNAYVLSVSCATTGSCTAGGFYFDGASHSQAFLVTGH